MDIRDRRSRRDRSFRLEPAADARPWRGGEPRRDRAHAPHDHRRQKRQDCQELLRRRLDRRAAGRRPGAASLMPRRLRGQRAEGSGQKFTPSERHLIARLRTPLDVQRYLNALPYNTEPPPARATLRSFRGVVRHHTAHCLEAALFAATVLEQHGYPPLVISFESIDELDHVIFAYQSRVQSPKSKVSGWGSVARSRDPGLHGRKPVFATPRALAASYVDTYVDLTGRVEAFALVDLRVMGNYEWRLSERNVWKVERMLLDTQHQPLRMSEARFRDFRTRYRAFKEKNPDRKPLFYEGRDKWTPI